MTPILLFSLVMTLIVSLAVGFSVYPLIIKISYKKKFFKASNKRTVHGKFVSTFGGIGIVFGFIMGAILGSIALKNVIDVNEVYGLIFPVLLVFMLGIWDDLAALKSYEKLLLQSISAIAMMGLLDLAIIDLNGLFGIHELPQALGYGLTFLIIVGLVNAVNLLDGIDGYAGSYLVLLSAFMLLQGYMLDHPFLMILAIATLGALLPFLYYNMYHKRKLFMGDSGSLVLGLIAGYFVLENFHLQNEVSFNFNHPIVLLLSLAALPLIDTLRVVVVRLSKGLGPFSPDKNHIHHRYLAMGLTHNQTTFIVMELTVALWLFTYWLDFLPLHYHFLATLAVALGLYLGPILVYRLKKSYF